MPREHPIQSVRTPHLESPGRSEKHWKILSESSLSSFREERQASSVVSRTRELFIEKTELIERRVAVAEEEYGNNELADDEKVSLYEIGSDLFSRYNVPHEEGNGERLQELIDDFLEMNGDALAEELKGEKEDVHTPQKQWDRVWDLIPSRLPQRDKLLTSGSPSILSILSTCMHAGEGNQLSLLLLLSRASLAGYDHIRFILRKLSDSTFKDEAFRDDGDFSDSEDSFASNNEATKTGKDGDETRVRLYSHVIPFLLDKIPDIYEKNMTKEDLSTYVSSQECLSVVHFSLAFSAELVRYLTNWAAVLDAPLDLRVYLSTQKLVRSLLKSGADEGRKRTFQSVFFHGLARILLEQRQTFPSILRPSGGQRLGRAFRHKVCLNRAQYIGAVAGEMACLMSRTHAELQSGQMIASYLVRFLNGSPAENEHSMLPLKLTSLVSLCESALWFWNYMSFQTSNEGHTVRVNINTSISSFDRPIIEVLYAPIASVIVGLCGSAINTRSMMCQETLTSIKSGDGLCLGELYDSDSSATELFLDADDFENISAGGVKRAKTEILRAICQAVHCVALVSCDVNAKWAVSYQPPTEDERQHGPLLPLVVCRLPIISPISC
jgi:hypothetical protein